MRLSTISVGVMIGIGLASCSGGGGGGTSEPMTITPTNAKMVAGSATATIQVADIQSITDFQTMTAETVSNEACPDGGLMSAGFQNDLAPIGEVSSGDIFTVSFSGCDLGSFRIDGDLAYFFHSIVGDPEVDAMWSVDISLDVDALTLNFGGASSTLDGNWTVSASQDGADSTSALAGDFDISVSDGSTTESLSFSGLEMTQTYDSASGTTTFTTEGTYSSSELGGSVTVTTLSPLVVVDGDENPSQGSVLITGANGSTVLVTVVDNTSVQLAVDEDGDQEVDFGTDAGWDELGEED